MTNGEFSAEEIQAARARIEALGRRAASVPQPQRALLAEALAEAGFLAAQLSVARGKLVESEERFHALAEGTNDVLYSSDANGVLTYVSPQVARYGLAPEDMVSRCFLDFVAPEDAEHVATDFARSIATGEEFPTELRIVDGEGRVRWLEDRGRVQRDRSGRITGINGILRDITERRQAERALRESEEKFKSLYDRSPIGIEIYDAEGRLLDVNQACLDIFGVRDAADVAGFRLFGDPNLPDEVKDRLRKGEVVAIDVPFDFEKVIACGLYRTSRRGVIHLEVLIAPLTPKEIGGQSGYLVQVQDTTLRKRLEAEVLAIGQRERLSIGRDLHDSVGQQLAAMVFSMTTLREKLAARSLPEAADAAHAVDLLRTMTAESRALVRGLCPVELKADGLAVALEGLADSVASRFGVGCVFECQGAVPIQDHSAATHLYRIAQEAVTNAIKHGKADAVVIRLVGCEDQIALTIQDNGVGLLEDRQGSEGMGLHIMNYRASVVGGRLSIQRRREGGTVVTCQLPRRRPIQTEGTAHGGE